MARPEAPDSAAQAPPPARRRRGFEPAFSLLRGRIRQVGESRGFAVTRLVTHWAEIVGAETARMCRPIGVGYARGGLGGTLTLLVPGALAPQVQMELPRIREQVNACYGFNAIARIRLSQTAPDGFSEAQAAFAPPPAADTPAHDPVPASASRRSEIDRAARRAASGVHDDTLRQAIEALAQNVLSRNLRSKGS